MRKINLIGEINYDLFSKFVEELDTLTSENDDVINVDLCSGGGDENIALAFFDKIRTCPADIHIRALGEIQSAAVLVLAAGDKRRTGPSTVFMVHDSEVETEGSTLQVAKEASRLEHSEETFYSLLGSRTKLSYAIWRKLSKEVTYFNANKAKEYGLVHSIV